MKFKKYETVEEIGQEIASYYSLAPSMSRAALALLVSLHDRHIEFGAHHMSWYASGDATTENHPVLLIIDAEGKTVSSIECYATVFDMDGKQTPFHVDSRKDQAITELLNKVSAFFREVPPSPEEGEIHRMRQYSFDLYRSKSEPHVIMGRQVLNIPSTARILAAGSYGTYNAITVLASDADWSDDAGYCKRTILYAESGPVGARFGVKPNEELLMLGHHIVSSPESNPPWRVFVFFEVLRKFQGSVLPAFGNRTRSSTSNPVKPPDVSSNEDNRPGHEMAVKLGYTIDPPSIHKR